MRGVGFSGASHQAEEQRQGTVHGDRPDLALSDSVRLVDLDLRRDEQRALGP